MPFIDSKVTVKMSDSQKEQIKTKLGQAIGLLGKTENFLVVGFTMNMTCTWAERS